MPHNITPCDQCGHPLDVQAPSFPLAANMYLRCGAQNSESEVGLCSNAIVGWQEEIYKYDAKIFRMKSALEKLQGVRQSLADCIRTSERLLAPIRRLPRDVLQDIFECLCVSVSYSPFSKRDDMPLISTTPFYLSPVCFYWRSICLSSPRLWTSIFANIDCDTFPPHFKDVLVLCDKRSGSLPSNLQVSAADGHNNPQRSGYKPFDALFYPHNVTMDPRHLKRIPTDFPHGAFANALHATQPLELPELEYLELSAHSLSCGTQPHHVYLINLFERIPKLHTPRLSLQDLVATPFTLQRDGIVNFHLVNYREYPSLPVDFPNVITATLRRCQLVFYETIELPSHKLILHNTDKNPSLFGTSSSSRHILKMPRLSSLALSPWIHSYTPLALKAPPTSRIHLSQSLFLPLSPSTVPKRSHSFAQFRNWNDYP